MFLQRPSKFQNVIEADVPLPALDPSNVGRV